MGVTVTDPVDIERLERFWESELLHSKYLMDSSTIVLIELTVKYLGKYKIVLQKERKSRSD